ncbi:MAG: hypothetical protein L7H18_00940 [Candidatus Nealsonbacteria bacterium DGGOD1a]|nr:MAG: hypothetical protein L7H18_00940 [Candidatus Nealsonbacteria bacterium DGGOD1a]
MITKGEFIINVKLFATIVAIIIVFAVEASSSYETAPHDQSVSYREDCAPWIKSYTTGYSKYIQPDDPIIRWFAARVTFKIGEGFFFNETGRQLNIAYASDRDVYPECAEYWQEVAITGTTLKGDCNDLSTFMCSLLIAKGYPAMVVRGYNKTTHQGHMWVECKAKGENYIIDFDQRLPRISCMPRVPRYLGYDEDYMFNDVFERIDYDPDW